MLGAWWQEREPRERVALVAGGLALLPILVYLLLEPRLTERARLAAEIPQLRQDLGWMRGQVAEIRRLRQQAGSSSQPAAGSLTPAAVERSLRGSGLGEKLEELGPDGEGRVRLVFPEVAFADLTEWLGRVREAGGAVVRKARIERIEAKDGMVEARLTLGSGEGS